MLINEQLVRKCFETLPRVLSGLYTFLLSPCGIGETQKLFHKSDFSNCKTTYVYVPLSNLGCWNIQEIQPYFVPVTIDSVWVFCHFAFWRHRTRLVSIFV